MMYEDRYLVPGGLWALLIGVSGIVAWIVAIVTIMRVAEGVQSWLASWWPL